MADPEDIHPRSSNSNACSIYLEGDDKSREKRKRRKRIRREEGEVRKRKLSEEQARFLEMRFWEERKLESGRKVQLAMDLGLDPKQVAVWFQNRRARWKSKHLEEEYTKLKSDHDQAILAKCHLEAEVLKLKEQLSVAHTEIARLSCESGGGGEVSSSPRSTSISVEANQPLLEENLLSFHSLASPWECPWNYWNMFGVDDLYSSPIF